MHTVEKLGRGFDPYGWPRAMTTPRRYLEAAIIDGLPAFVFARCLRRHWRDDIEDLPLYLRPPLEDALEAMNTPPPLGGETPR